MTPAPRSHIVLEQPDAAWPDAFARESEQIRAVLGDRLLALHHIGSTAIPGIVAKPVIDMLAVVDTIALLDDQNILNILGYEGMGEFGIAGRRYFRKTSSTGIRTHQLHAFDRQSAEVQRHVDFRDYLRAHPKDAQAYDALKRELAARCVDDMTMYTEGKTSFVRDIEQRAAIWRSADGALDPTR